MQDGENGLKCSDPTHLVVQSQLQDVIQTLRAENDKLRAKLQEKEVDSIPYEQYESCLKLLEAEKISHAETRAKLMETEDKLDFTQGQVEILTKQIEREKRQFENAFGKLKKRALRESSKNVELHNHCKEVEGEVGEKSSELANREVEIKELKQKLEESKLSHQVALSELEIQRQQEAYMMKLLGENKKQTQTKTKIRTAQHTKQK